MALKKEREKKEEWNCSPKEAWQQVFLPFKASSGLIEPFLLPFLHSSPWLRCTLDALASRCCNVCKQSSTLPWGCCALQDSQS